MTFTLLTQEYRETFYLYRCTDIDIVTIGILGHRVDSENLLYVQEVVTFFS